MTAAFWSLTPNFKERMLFKRSKGYNKMIITALSKISNFFSAFEKYISDYVLFPISQIGVVDVIDIFLISLVLYYTYRFIRIRRAGKLAGGIILIIALYFVSWRFGLLTVYTILKNLSTVGIIAVVVIFQPELRDALEKMGTSSLKFKNLKSGRTKAVEIAHMVNEIADAARALSAEGYGALIVIERTTRLGDYINKGVKLDAVVSQQLLRNIFVNKAPLHDGGVIIKDMKIAAASCKFPLSSNESMLGNLGTRHRAAVGITEVSDAVVIIVSEETGAISIANNKLLKRNYTYEALLKDLYKLLSGEEYSELELDNEDMVISEHKNSDSHERRDDQ